MPRKLRVRFAGINTMQANGGAFALTGNAASFAASNTSDFVARRTSPGVFRWFDFEDASQAGELQLASAWSGTTGIGYQPCASSGNRPTLDSTVRASGTTSLRYDIPSQSPADASGNWLARFSPDGSIKFGLNSEFYVQFRCRWNDAFMTTFFVDVTDHVSAQPGIKFFDVNSGAVTDTNTIEKFVVCTHAQQRFPIVYQGEGEFGADSELDENIGSPPSDYKLQNALSPATCLYSSTGTGLVRNGCVHMVANEWTTYQLGVTIMDQVDASHWNARIRLWFAREAQPSTLLIDWGPTTPGYTPPQFNLDGTSPGFIGKTTIFPYLTRKDPAQVHPLCQMWVDEVICSTQRIPDPQTQTYPTWRQGKTVGTLFAITGTAQLSHAADIANTEQTGGAAAIVNAWCGLTASPSAWYSCLGGGHGDGWVNMSLKLDLSQNAPVWTVLDPGSQQANAVKSATCYYLDGRPAATHTYYSQQYVAQRNRIMVFAECAPYPDANGAQSVNGFNLATNTWDPEGTWPNVPAPGMTVETATGTDPRTGDVFVATTDRFTFWRWFQSTGGWGQMSITGAYPASWINTAGGSLYDINRNKWVTLVNPAFDFAVTQASMQRLDTTTYAMDNIALTGVSGIPGFYGAMCHDLDNDRYLYCGTPDSGTTYNLYAIDPTTGATTILLQMPTKPFVGSGGDTGMQCRMAYFSQFHGVAILPQFSSDVLFLPTA